MILVLSAFVAAIVCLQQASELPSPRTLVAMGAAALLASLLAFTARARHAAAARLTACLAAALFGCTYAAWCAHQRLSDELAFADEGRDVQLIGIVAGLPAQIEQGVRFPFEVERVLPAAAPPGAKTPPAQIHIPRLITLTWYQNTAPVHPAQRWRMTARLKRPHGTYNPAGFDTELWMLEAGVRAAGYVRDGHGQTPTCLQDFVWRFNPWVDRLRDALRSRLQQQLQGQRYGGVIIALVMGDQGLIAQGDWTLFNRTGISHLVSISGLHITMIAALVALACAALWRRSPRLLARAPLQTVRAIAGTGGALAYCLLAGWGVPAQRTFVMLATVAAALGLRLRLGAGTVLAAAAAIVCLWDPWAVTAAGFWLSFGAVASIFLACHGRLPEWSRNGADGADGLSDGAPPGWRARGRAARRAVEQMAREAVRVQAAVTVGLVPLTLMLFQQVSLISPLANAVAIPAVSYLVAPCALLGALLCSLGDWALPVAHAVLLVSHALFAWLAAILNWLVDLRYAWIGFAAPPVWAVMAAGAGIAWLLAPPGWPLRGVGAAWLVPVFVIPAPRPAPGELWLTALDVGQGMALVLESDQATVVFDTGPRIAEEIDAGARVIVPYLRARGLDRADLLVVSHQDSDHSGGARSLLTAVPVAQVLTSIAGDDPMWPPGTRVQRCEAGQQMIVGDLLLAVFNPPASQYDQPRATTNSKSCVLLVSLGDTRVLLTGDVPAREEAGMVAAYGSRLAAQWMAAPHHGSKTSSSETLIDAVHPRWVSVQAGYRSRFGHPHPDVVARYARHGVRLVRSDWSGAARWRFGRSGAVQLEQWRLDHARYWLNQPGRRGALAVASAD